MWLVGGVVPSSTARLAAKIALSGFEFFKL
jgi:hypothetical protein